MPGRRYPREITREAAKELARMLYEDEKRLRMVRENQEKRKVIAEALNNLNSYGWVLCPYTGEYVQTDPKKAEVKIINGALFWINECNGKKVYVNIYLDRYSDPTGMGGYIAGVNYLTEEEMDNWLHGKAIGSRVRTENDIRLNDINKNENNEF